MFPYCHTNRESLFQKEPIPKKLLSPLTSGQFSPVPALLCSVSGVDHGVIMGLSGGWVASNRTPWIALIISIFILEKTWAQCHVNQHVSTRPNKNLEYRVDILDLGNIIASVLEYTAIIKLELPGESEGVFVTPPGSTLCPVMGEGYDLGYLTTGGGRSLVNFVPLLTNILQVSPDRFLLPN